MRKPNTPPRGLRKTLSVLTAGIMLTAGLAALPANAATTTAGLPDHIVNGDFEYPKGLLPLNGHTLTGKLSEDWWYNWTSISPTDGTYLDLATNKQWAATAPWKPISNFNATQFGWKSTQDGTGFSTDSERKAGAVEIQHDYKTGNIYAEMTAAQQHTAIYQDIATTPGAVYTWSLKHASMDGVAANKMSVLIGAPGKETPQEAYRTTVNGAGDTVGDVGTVIATNVKGVGGQRDYSNAWETYTGKYVVPAGQTVTRFTFKAVDSLDDTHGNMLDDISFSVSYPLHYDLKGGSGTAPQQHD